MSLDTLTASPPSVAPPPIAAPTPFRSADFDQAVMGTYGRFPIALDRGAGCRVMDTEGHEYLDFVAGIATCTLGHAHPALVATLSRQIQKLHHVSNLYYIPEQGALAQWLVQRSCGDRAFFCNSGAEANEGAIKLARKYGHTVLKIENPVILTADASFHGRTLATITATGQPQYQQHFNPLVPGFHYVPFNDFAALTATIEELDQDQRQVAAILLEPLQGEGGVRPGEVEYFQRVRDLCTTTGILLILDEVQVGVGRTGKLWGYENLGIEPDIFTSAKGLAGGIPMGAVLSQEFCSVFQPGDHASTFGGNPLSCAAALCVCETLESDNILANVHQRGEQLRAGLGAIATQYPEHIAEVRGWGLINGLVLQQESDLTAMEVVKAALAQGLLLVPAGSKVVRFVPPLIVRAVEIDQAVQIVTQVMAELS